MHFVHDVPEEQFKQLERLFEQATQAFAPASKYVEEGHRTKQIIFSLTVKRFVVKATVVAVGVVIEKSRVEI